MVASTLTLLSAAMHIARTLQHAGLAAQLEETSAGALSAMITVMFAGKPLRVTVEPDHGPAATNVAYLLWAVGDDRESPPYEPLHTEHPAYKMACWACNEALGDGKPVRLIAIGADTDTERAMHRHRTLLVSLHATHYLGALAFPGSHSLRLSMDFATGSAGVLRAMTLAGGGEGPLLPFL